MQKKYILVVNPISGGEDKAPIIAAVQDYGKSNNKNEKKLNCEK